MSHLLRAVVDEAIAEHQAADTAEEPTGPRLMVTMASDITPTSPEWLVKGWLLLRALNLLVARQGTGKTTFAAHVTAVLTRGLAVLVGDQPHAPIRAGFLSLEEPADRVTARLHAANADLTKVAILGDVEDVDDEGRTFRRRWRLPGDVAILGQQIVAHGLSLVIVDGLGYSIAGTTHNYGTVGSALSALAGEAERTGCAILGLVHPPKGSSDPVTAAIGSTAWTAIPRISLVMGLDPDDDSQDTRVVSVGKSNYRVPDTSLAFTIGEDAIYECGAVVGLHATSVTAEQVMAAPPSTEERTERSEARSVLSDLLGDGPVAADEVERLVEDAGISRRTYFRARKDLGVVSCRRHDPTTGKAVGWTLELAAVHSAKPECQPPPALAQWHSGHSGHTQVKHLFPCPECQATESGTLDGDER